MENKFSQIWEEQKEKKSIFNILQQRYLPYWPILLFSTILGFASVYFYLKTTLPIYLVTATVELKDQKSAQNSVLDALDVFGESKIVDNEIEILKSRTLMHSVVDSLKLYSSQYLISTYRDFELFGEKAPFEVTALNPNLDFNNSGMNEVSINWDSSSFYLNKIKYHFGDTILIGNSPFIININPSFISSNKNYKNTFKDAFLLEIFNKSDLVTEFTKNFNINPSSKQSTILNLQFETETREKGSLIINTLLKHYQEANINFKNLTAQNTLKFIDNRLKNLLDDINITENNINIIIKQFEADIPEIQSLDLKAVAIDKARQAFNILGSEYGHLILALLENTEYYKNNEDIIFKGFYKNVNLRSALLFIMIFRWGTMPLTSTFYLKLV